jgi:hypothetical protein
MLTETSVRASDRRAVFVGVEAFEATGGVVLRDLFQGDDGGWLEVPAQLDRVVDEKLQTEAEALAAERLRWGGTGAADAEKLVAVGEAPVRAGIPASEVAAWTMVSHAILASDLAIVKD